MCQNGYLPLFSCAYWKSAAREFKNRRILTFAALMIAASVIISFLFIPVGENLKIYFAYLANCLCGTVCGPLVGLTAGFITDLIGFVMHPTGGFFPGYTLSTMLGFFVFALFLYRKRITVLRVFCSRLVVNVFINVGLGSLWNMILFGKGFYYFAAKSIIKNLLMLPIEVILLLLLLRALIPLLARKGLIPKPKDQVMPLI